MLSFFKLLKFLTLRRVKVKLWIVWWLLRRGKTLTYIPCLQYVSKNYRFLDNLIQSSKRGVLILEAKSLFTTIKESDTANSVIPSAFCRLSSLLRLKKFDYKNYNKLNFDPCSMANWPLDQAITPLQQTAKSTWNSSTSALPKNHYVRFLEWKIKNKRNEFLTSP